MECYLNIINSDLSFYICHMVSETNLYFVFPQNMDNFISRNLLIYKILKINIC